MPPLLSSRAARIGLAVALLLLGAVGFVPLFGGPGYESALAAGLVLPFAVAIVTAVEVAPARPAPVDAVARGLAHGAVFALAAYAVALVHGARAGFCDFAGGSAHFTLGPGAGALVAGVWGAVAAELAGPRRGRAAAFAVLGPLVSIAVSVGRFYASPMVFAYDPFVGYFSGTIYDTVVDFGGLVSYRAGTAATLVAAGVLTAHVAREEGGRLRLVWPTRAERVALGLAAAIASAMITFLGPRLGHWNTAATIASELGARLSGARCDLVYARTIRPADAERFLRECDAHVAAGERWFDASGPPRITAYLFADAAQKGALMGASDTYVAKPWRREIYVQNAGFPHPTLGHEIMHVLAGSFARGPFAVAGSFGGLLPNPGLIEGTAVAAAPPDGDLEPREWAKAMKDLGILPRLDRLFALGFLGENSGAAYTVSGAFVGWVKERFGAAALRAWYGGRSLSEVTGVPWEEVERSWREDLDAIALPDAARAQAKARFDRPAIFGRRCPHAIDACKERADRQRAAGDDRGAAASYEDALVLDPADGSAKLALAKELERLGRAAEGEAALQRIADDASAPRHVRDRALEELADLALARGDGEAARAIYAEVASRTVDEDHLRTLDVKAHAAKNERARPAIVALLIGTRGRPPDKLLAVDLLATWASEPGADGLPPYLLGRQLLGAGQFEEAAERLDRALAAGTELPRVRVEAERLRLLVACALGDAPAAARFYEGYARRPEVTAARREAARALVGRCGGNAERGR